MGFAPAVPLPHGLTAGLIEWLDYNYDRQLLLRFTKPVDPLNARH
jgi:hypothetical protein